MLNARQILVSAPARHAARAIGLTAIAVLAGCGQKGALFLPTDPAAAQRATLPQVITGRGNPAAATPAAAASAPAATTPPTPAPASRP